MDVSSAICCSFAMYKSDLPPGLDWQTVVAGPVRASRAISSPWGRTYQSAGKPSVPHLCDTFMFRAKVSKADILQLLQKSGFNYMFAWSPGMMKTAPWPRGRLSGSRPPVKRQSSKVCLCRSSSALSRAGVNTDSGCQQMPSGKPLRNSVLPTFENCTNSGLCRWGRQASVQTWIVAIQWEAKVLKSLSPSGCGGGRFMGGVGSWSKYRSGKENSSGPASASSTTGSSGATTLSRLHALETNLAAMQALQGQERQERLEDRAHVAQEFTKSRGEVQTLNSGLAAQLQASLDSLRSAQQSQERQMAQGMDELKALIVSSHAKKQRTDHDDL